MQIRLGAIFGVIFVGLAVAIDMECFRKLENSSTLTSATMMVLS